MMSYIELENVSRIYDVDGVKTTALTDVNLKIDRGESVAIMGVSGSGKTTLLSIIGLLDDMTDGNYVLDGQEVSGMLDSKKAELRSQKFGIVFQNLQLVESESVKNNVEIGLFIGNKYKIKEFESRIDCALSQLGIAQYKKKKVKFLSGGERQRVAIARAIINDPDIILADEPTSALDSKTANEIIAIFDSLKNDGKTIILVTHDINVAQKMDRIIYIKDGKIQL